MWMLPNKEFEKQTQKFKNLEIKLDFQGFV